MTIISDIIKDISKSIIKDIIGIDSGNINGSSTYYVTSNGILVFSNGEQVTSTPAGISVNNILLETEYNLLLEDGYVIILE